MGEFWLEAREFQNLTRWRWVLIGPGGALVADHQVQLDVECWQYEAFTDLRRYLRLHAAPDQRTGSEARIVAQVGAWIGTDVLGAVGAALVNARPATVRVTVPDQPEMARSLLFYPLELAHVQGRPLALQDVTLVMQLNKDAETVTVSEEISNARERLRVLGLFSLPTGAGVLNLRHERHALVSLLSGIAARGRVVDVRALQYGVTRDRLRSVLEEDEGWDVIHVSGHGAPGELLLEKEDGSPDRVSSAALAGLLDAARERVKLVTLSTCWSAALTVAGQRQALGLPVGEPATGSEERAGHHGGFAAGTLATELADRLGCAVLAMRYPVVEDFAIVLASKLYDLLADEGQPLPRALGMALRQSVPESPTPACPALSAGTPALFGARAVGLRLAAPQRRQDGSSETGTPKMTGFPPQPDRFVGRTGVMARASAALADASGVPGILLHGMPGGGKTACALELAYTHEHAFDRLIWFKAPDEDRDIAGALTEFALTLERELPGFQMVHLLADDEKLAGFLPRLTELVERRRVLIVIDNIESLLGESGQWRDARWEQVISALFAHAGLGRTVLTSRRMPLNPARLVIEAVDALSLDEALLLTAQLPHLQALMEGKLPGVAVKEARRLARGVLNIAQGHPKLLELADGQASDPVRLGALVQAGDQAWRWAGGLPDGFFSAGEPQASSEDYRHVLAAWTQAVSDTLEPGERTMFWFLCCLEEDDRIRPVANNSWANLWNGLELDGDPPDLDPVLTALAARGLTTLQPETDDADEAYGIHPAVAAAGRAQAGKQFQDVVDRELAASWSVTGQDALERESADPTSSLVAHATLAAAPYLLRLGEWAATAQRLEIAFNRDPSRQTAATALPALQTIVATGQEPDAAFVLAKVLRVINPAAAERQLRAYLAAAVTHGEYRTAALAAESLIDHRLAEGQLAEALTLAEEAVDYTRRAGLGPWTRLLAESRRLQVLSEMGQTGHALAEVQRLRKHMQTIPASPDQPEVFNQWSAREMLLGIGASSALQLGRWNDVLDLDAAIAVSMRDRGAPATEIARARFNDTGPLIELGRYDDALALLRECRQVFEDTHNIQGLWGVLSVLADLEDDRGHDDAAISLRRDALRYGYVAQDVMDAAISHHNLGSSLHRFGRWRDGPMAHHLAAALIGVLAAAGHADQSADAAADDLRATGMDAVVPGDVAELCRQVSEVPGVDLGLLLTALAPDPGEVEQAFQELLMHVRLPVAATTAGQLASWDPVIAALLAAKSGKIRAAAVLMKTLARYRKSASWGMLAVALRRIRAGETGPELLAGLDDIDSAIVTRALGVCAGRVSIPADLWRAVWIGPLLGDVVAGALGDADARGRARQHLEKMAGYRKLVSLAAALDRIIDGDRDPNLAAHLADPVHAAVVATVLHHISHQTGV